MRIHFIAIGGSAMHNLAIALHKKGFEVTGSDDEIFEPSKGRLQQYGLLPAEFGWYPEKLTQEIDAIILGMHARADNPELLRAQEMGLKIYSYPEYLYEQTKDKIRVVIGGSHGKTSITSMIMHVLKTNRVEFDYMVGAKLEGFDTMVSLSHESNIAVFEGDEYLSSPIDRRPKFHLYHPNIALLSGIAWDHINVFPTFENYVDQFRQFVDLIEKDGSLFYFEGDENLQDIAMRIRTDVTAQEYREHSSVVENGVTYLTHGDHKTKLQVFGDHNLQNIAGAKLVCNKLGISDDKFYMAMGSFKGAARRLEILAENDSCTVFYDFAHSPSKLKATTGAVKKQFDDRKLVAVMELHTFSSLKKEFLPHYENCMEAADEAFVYFDPHTIEHKRLEPISAEQVAEAFATEGLQVFTDSDKLFQELRSKSWEQSNLLIMTSGNFSGKNVTEIASEICNHSVQLSNDR
ncbi:UDP-N-acetylmuramate--L-alanine ligase [Mangrovibacterium diazotrophicum]|uniref:UDP-N-acetylmuramate: L-alanyl-gamma-D-glutamyl-meso-diaminopimelate ligase n=1 Tax=Mangrovibacterium diazotrophicum TaxID=1261403 RepID=A0A419W8X6_9BACT|nr:Mur ligase family protein [Mangrovibacterium diazotrophicum]RKD91896.1 UDP-N-acetylmuramate: L-alanyl-gamma-D-glutamyl-meso-diaminopimelate ligase [Mangrovibacterium diazotrophicum]